MKRLNYGLALSSSGEYQVINTSYSPGIRDEWSEILEESFLFLVAPAKWVDAFLNIKHQSNYWEERRLFMDKFQFNYMTAIMQYYGFKDLKEEDANDFAYDKDTEDIF